MSFQEEIKELLAKYSQSENRETEKGEVTADEDQAVEIRSAEEEPSGPEDLEGVDSEEQAESEEEQEIKGSPEGETEETIESEGPAIEEPSSETPVDFGPAIEKVSKTIEELLARIDRLESARVKAAGGAESKRVEVENQDWLNKLF